jgi:NitT/TauT family transport system permease protein
LNTDKEKQKLIRIMGGKKRHIFTMVVLPAGIPTIISNMKVNIGLALVGVMIGEFLAAKQGLGYLIIYASQVFKLDWLILCILILCIIAIVLYETLNLLEKKLHQ